MKLTVYLLTTDQKHDSLNNISVRNEQVIVKLASQM